MTDFTDITRWTQAEVCVTSPKLLRARPVTSHVCHLRVFICLPTSATKTATELIHCLPLVLTLGRFKYKQNPPSVLSVVAVLTINVIDYLLQGRQSPKRQ